MLLSNTIPGSVFSSCLYSSRHAARLRAVALALALLLPGSLAHAISADAVEDAVLADIVGEGREPAVVRLQILLDRARFSPGAIDGYVGRNLEAAVAAFARAKNLSETTLGEAVFEALAGDEDDVLRRHTITEEDVEGPFRETIPERYDEMAALDRLPYRGPAEALAERFHMDVELLRMLNPEADFGATGTEIVVAAVRDEPPERMVARIEVDADRGVLRGYDEDGDLVVFYPATVGSEEMPSPEGTHAIEIVVHEPNWTYDPDGPLRQEGVDEAVIVPPGPNNPVGLVWIGLDEEGYGIHGAPDATAVGHAASHGCVRLTNWDAKELAALVEEGVSVEFLR